MVTMNPEMTLSRVRLIVGLSLYTMSFGVCQMTGAGPTPAPSWLTGFYATLGFSLGMFCLIYIPLSRDVRPMRYLGIYLTILGLLVWREPSLTTADTIANLTVITSIAAAAFAARYTEMPGYKMWTQAP